MKLRAIGCFIRVTLLTISCRSIASAAAVVCFAAMLIQFGPAKGPTPVYAATYLEALEADHAPEQMTYQAVLNGEDPSPAASAGTGQPVR